MRYMLTSALFVLAACSEGASNDPVTTPEVPGAASAEPPDAQFADAGGREAALPVGTTPDSQIPAEPIPTLPPPDTELPDTGLPDIGLPDTGLPDTGATDAGAPDAGPLQVLPLLAPPLFEPPHTLFEAAFALKLVAGPGVSIHYTLDGSTPSAVVGILYGEPIPITTTTVVRAVVFTPAGELSATRTQTYIRLKDVIKQSNSPGPGWPLLFAATDAYGPYPADYEMDPEIVNHPNYAGTVESALSAIPAVSLVTDLPNLWDPKSGIYANPNQKSDLWERPASIEWIDPAGGPGFTENAGVRLHGQASRRPHRQPKKTFRVYFRAAYGAGKLSFPLFGDAGGLSRFDRLLLRNGGNRSWPYWDRDQRREADYVNDEWARRAQLEMGGLNARGTYAQLYLNGVYWGLYNVTERPDDKFLAGHLGGPDTDYDLIKADEDLDDIPVADAGTIAAYEELMALLQAETVSAALHDEIAARVDLVDLADFIILTHYIGKTDWPNHNWLAYRKRVGPDTRFRFIAWDNDSGLNKVEQNNSIGEFPGSPVMIFNRLVTHAGFRQLLSERLYRHVAPGGALSPERCGTRYKELTDKLDRAVIGESARWGDYSRDVYQWQQADPPKSGPAYLYSRDLSLLQADPSDIADDKFQNNWVQVRNTKLNTYCPRRASVLIKQYVDNGWIAAR